MRRNGLLFFGCFLYLVLSFLAIWYYRERVIFSDSSYMIFLLISTKYFGIQCDRFVALFTQAFPLISTWLHLPLKAVLISYSLSFILCNFAIFLTCLLALRQPGFALAILLFSIFIVRNSFFWIQSELTQGVAFCVLLFAYLAWLDTNRLKRVIHILLLLALLSIVVFAHPLMIFVFALSSFYFLLSGKAIDRKVLLIAMAGFTIVWLYKRFGVPVPLYDIGAMKRADNLTDLFPHYFDLPANVRFVQNLSQHYYALPIALVAISVILIRQGKWILLLFIIVSVLGYLLLINVSYFDDISHYYMEPFYLSLSILLIFPLVFDVLLPVSGRKWFIPLLMVFLVLRVVDIVDGSAWYRNRLAWNEHLLEETSQMPHHKLIIDAGKVPMNTLEFTWSSGYELLELSSLASPDSARCVAIDQNPDKDQWMYRSNHRFVACFDGVDYKDLDHRYFNPADTTGYVLLDHL